MLKKTITVFLALLLIVLFFAGCGKNTVAEQNKSGAAQKQLVHTLTDSKGNKVVLPIKPQKILSLTLGTDELLIDLVQPERLAALTYLSDDPGISHVFAQSKQVKNKIRGQNAEEILSLKPDLVLIADWWSLNILQTLRDMGINVYVYKTPYKVADIRNTIAEVANVVGEQERGRTMIKEFDKKIKNIQDKTAPFAQEKKRKLIAITGKGAFGTKGSLYDDMCGYAHIANCLKDLKIDDCTTVSKELIVRQNPDVIIVPDWSSPGMLKVDGIQEILTDPSLHTVTAVQSKQVKYVPGKSLYCVSHYSAESIASLAQAVYPDAF